MNAYNVHQKALDRHGREASFVGVSVAETDIEARREAARYLSVRASTLRAELRTPENTIAREAA